MDVTSVIARLESALAAQVRLAGEDPAIEAAAEALITALEPAMRRAAMDLAEQAAVEVRSHLTGYSVDVVVRDGDPTMSIRTEETTPGFVADDLEARLTLRLPAMLKGLVEESAAETGDSVNTYVVKALAGRANQRRSTGQRIKGTVES